MDVAEVYDNAARGFGLRGRLSRERFTTPGVRDGFDGIAEVAEQLIASARTLVPRLPPIHFDYFCEGTVNALVFKKEDQYFIAINSGTIVLLQLIFCRMLSDPKLLLQIGDPTGESPDVPVLLRLMPDAEKMYQAGELFTCKPKTEARWQYACHLVSEAMRFLVGHEIAHITRGHVDYLSSVQGTSVFSEVAWTDSGLKGKIERQSIECDADRRSINSNLSSICLTLQQNSHMMLPWTGEGPTVAGLFYDCAFAVNTLFRVFGDQRMTGVDMSVAYPPAPLRRLMLMSLMLGFAELQWGESSYDVVSPATKLAVSETEIAYATITGDELSAEVKQDVFGDRSVAKSHIRQIIGCWESDLRERLEPFAYEPLE